MDNNYPMLWVPCYKGTPIYETTTRPGYYFFGFKSKERALQYLKELEGRLKVDGIEEVRIELSDLSLIPYLAVPGYDI